MPRLPSSPPRAPAEEDRRARRRAKGLPEELTEEEKEEERRKAAVSWHLALSSQTGCETGLCVCPAFCLRSSQEVHALPVVDCEPCRLALTLPTRRPRWRRRSEESCPSSRCKVGGSRVAVWVATSPLPGLLHSSPVPAAHTQVCHQTSQLIPTQSASDPDELLPPVLSPAVGEKMRRQLVEMKKAHPGQEEAVKVCWNTLLKMCGNVYTHPGA